MAQNIHDAVFQVKHTETSSAREWKQYGQEMLENESADDTNVATTTKATATTAITSPATKARSVDWQQRYPTSVRLEHRTLSADAYSHETQKNSLAKLRLLLAHPTTYDPSFSKSHGFAQTNKSFALKCKERRIPSKPADRKSKPMTEAKKSAVHNKVDSVLDQITGSV